MARRFDLGRQQTSGRAWKSVKFLASPEAQRSLEHRVVFPAVPARTELAKEAMAKKAWMFRPTSMRQMIRM